MGKQAEINVEDLIAEVNKRSVLWDRNDENYHNRTHIEKTWKDIEKTLHISKDRLKKKWKNIRDQFRNECKKIPTIKIEDCGSLYYKNFTSWPHFSSLLFLKEQLRPRSCAENIEASSSKATLDHFFDEQSIDTNIRESIQEESDIGGDNYTPKNKKAKIIKQSAVDDDQAFFDSTLPYMRKMDMDVKLRCRIELLKVIKSYSDEGERVRGTPIIIIE